MMSNKNKVKVHPVLRILRLMFSTLGPLFPHFFMMRAFNMWYTTARYSKPEFERAAVSKATRTSIEVTGIDVRVWIWGEGKPVLFVHGWSGRGTQVASLVNPLLQAGYQVISYDAPAHGETAGKQTSIFQVYDVLMAMEEKYGPFHATVAHSFGGMMLAYAMTNNFEAGRAIILNSPSDVDTILLHFQRMLAIPDKVIELMRQRLYLFYGISLRKRMMTEHNASQLSQPALIIHDEDDDEIPWQEGKAIADAWHDSRFMLTHGLGHRRILKDEKVIDAIVDFIDRT